MVKAVIFDMDGLMIDTEKLLVKYWMEAAHHYGYDMKKELALRIRSQSADITASMLRAEISPDFDYHKVRELRIRLMQEHIDKYGLEEKPGLGELLDYLKGRHYLAVVATSTDLERTRRYLGSLGRIQYFDQIVCASMVENGKPEPDIYLEAAARLGIGPEECLALEDSPNGVISAYRAGMYPVMVPDLSQPEEDIKKLLYQCVPNLAEVIQVLQELEQQEKPVTIY